MKKPRNKIKEVIIVTIAFVLFVLCMELIFGRRLTRMTNQIRSDFYARQVKLQEYEEMVRKLPDPQKAIEDIEKKAEEFKTIEINKRQIPRIIQLLGHSVEERKLTIVNIRPRDDIKGEEETLPTGITKVYVEMVLNCSYQQLGDYLAGLSKLPVVFIIEDISIDRKPPEAARVAEAKGKTDEKSSNLVAKLLLSTYMIWEM